MSSNNPPCICLWDLHSFPVPDIQLQPLVTRIRQQITSDIGKNSEKAFLVCCDVRALSTSTTKTLNKIRNLDILHVDRQANWSANEKVKQKLHQYDIDFRNAAGTILLISGNSEFSYFLSNMSRSGWSVFLFHPPNTPRELLDCVDYHFDLQDIQTQENNERKLKKDSSNIDENSFYVLITNLPMVKGAESIIYSLLSISDEFTPALRYMNAMTGEAVLSYTVNEKDAKKAAIPLLTKSYRKLIGKHCRIIAIKDPEIELTRMKFTVQQHQSNESLLVSSKRSRTFSSSSFGDGTEPSSGVSSEPSSNQLQYSHDEPGPFSENNNQRISPRIQPSVHSTVSMVDRIQSEMNVCSIGNGGYEESNMREDCSDMDRNSVTENTKHGALDIGEDIESKSVYSDAKTDTGETYEAELNQACVWEEPTGRINPSNSQSNDDNLQVYIDGSFCPDSGRVREEFLNSDWASVVRKNKHRSPVPAPSYLEVKRTAKELLASNTQETLATNLETDQQPRMDVYSNSYRPASRKSSAQCFHWDNTTHLADKTVLCRFYHPKERCRFYPKCMIGAELCGYAHPFCAVYCECASGHKDAQKNHRPFLVNSDERKKTGSFEK